MCGSGEVEGVVDFREDAALVRNLEDEAAEADSLSDCFPDEGGEAVEGLGFRNVEIEGRVESVRREAALVSATPVEATRLVGPVGDRALGRGGDF